MERRNMKRDAIGAVVGIAAFYGLLFLLGITCPIKYLTGVSCMGCGMTRAWISFIKGDIHTAFSFHPLFLLPALFLPLYLFRKRIPKMLLRSVFIIAVMATVAVYLKRMIDPRDVIVVCRPEEGAIERFIFFIFSKIS